MAHFNVRIEFREPTFELATEPRAEPYTWTVDDVEAKSAEEAGSIAVTRFKHLASLSNVGWVREIERVSVSTLA